MTENIKVLARLGRIAYFSFTDIPHTIFYGIVCDDSITIVERQPSNWSDFNVAFIRNGKTEYNKLPTSSKFIKRCEKYFDDIIYFFFS